MVEYMINSQDPIDPTIKNLVSAIGRAETGGSSDPYNQKGGSGEFGKYQFMPDTWKSWSKQYIGDENAPMTVENQNKVAYSKVKELKDKGYNPAQIASIWNSGAPDWTGKVGVNRFGVKYDTPSYVKRVSSYYNEIKGKQPISDVTSTAYKPISEQEKAQPQDFFTEFEQSPVGKIAHVAGSFADALSKASSFVSHVNLNPLSLVSTKAPKMGLADITREIGRAAGGTVGAGEGALGQLLINAFSPSRGLFQGVLEKSAEESKAGQDFWSDKFQQAGEAAPLAFAGAGSEALAGAGSNAISTIGNVASKTVNAANKAMEISMGYEGAKALHRGEYDKAVNLLAPLVAGKFSDIALQKMTPGAKQEPHVSDDPQFKAGMKTGIDDRMNNRTPQGKLIEKRRQIYSDALNVREGDTKAFLKKGRNINQTLDDIGEMNLMLDKDPQRNQVDTEHAQSQIQQRLDNEMAIVNDVVKSQPTASIKMEDWKNKTESNIDDSNLSKSEKLDMKDYLSSQFERLSRAYPDGNISPKDILLERRNLGNRKIKWDATPREKMENIVDKQMYHAGNDSLQNAFKGTEYEDAIKRSNENVSRLMDAKTLLERANGRIVKGGRLGNMWRRTMGFLMGHAIAGPIGGIAGELAGGAASDYVSDPAWATKRAARINRKLRSNMGSLDRAHADLVKDIFTKKLSPAEIAKRPLALPPGTPVNAATQQMPLPQGETIPLPSPGVISSQKRIAEPSGPVIQGKPMGTSTEYPPYVPGYLKTLPPGETANKATGTTPLPSQTVSLPEPGVLEGMRSIQQKATAEDVRKFIAQRKAEAEQKRLEKEAPQKIDIQDTPLHNKIMEELIYAEKGRRLAVRNEGTSGMTFSAQRSTFPQWIPEGLREKPLLDAVVKHLENGTVPTNSRERRLYSVVSEEINAQDEVTNDAKFVEQQRKNLYNPFATDQENAAALAKFDREYAKLQKGK